MYTSDFDFSDDIRVDGEVGRLNVFPDEFRSDGGDLHEHDGSPEIESRVEICGETKIP